MLGIIYTSPLQINFGKINLLRTVSAACYICIVIGFSRHSTYRRRSGYGQCTSGRGKATFQRHVCILFSRFPDLNLGHIKFYPVFAPGIGIGILFPDTDIHTRYGTHQRDTPQIQGLVDNFRSSAFRYSEHRKTIICIKPEVSGNLLAQACLLHCSIAFACHTLEDTVAIRKVGKHNKFIFIICIYALKQCSTVFSTTCHILRTDAHMPQGSEIISVRIKLKNTKGLDSRSGIIGNQCHIAVGSRNRKVYEGRARRSPVTVRLLLLAGRQGQQHQHRRNNHCQPVQLQYRFILHILYFIIIL